LKLFWVLTSILSLCAAAYPAAAQIPSVREINIYGLQKVSAERILQAAKLQSGQPLPPSKGEMEEAIAKVPGVLRARVEAVCCEDKYAVLFVGVEERTGPHVEFHAQPTGNATLSEDVMDAYHEFLTALQRSAQSKAGKPGERDPGLAAATQKFTAFASTRLAELRNALRDSPDPEERAAAAVVIGYARDKSAIAADLQYAMRDPDEEVRGNAIRSLHAAVMKADTPTQAVPVPLTALVDLLHSIVLSDRTEAADMLVTVTDDGNPQAIDLLRSQALPALVEMARWKSLFYALPPFMLVGRIAGLPEEEIQSRWTSGDREYVIRKALATVRPATPATKPAAPKQPAK
jgi:HEAT repeats